MRTLAILASTLLAASVASAAGTWQITTPLPVSKSQTFAVNWNGSICIVGGAPWRNGGDQDGSVYMLQSGAWVEVEPLTGMGPVVGQNGGIDGLNRVIVFGGHTIPEADPGATRPYTPNDGTGGLLTDGIYYGYDYTGCAVDGQHRVYRIGGGLGPYGLNYSSVARFNGATDTWEGVASLPYSRSSVATAYDGQGHIWGFGGYTSFGVPRLYDTIRYDVATNTWTTIGGAFLPVQTSNAKAVLGADGKIYVIGGMISTTPTGPTTDAVWVLNPTTQTLSAGPSLNISRADFGAALGSDKFIYVIGGSSTWVDASQSVERLYTGVCPSITGQSNATTVAGGATLLLNGSANGDAPLTYQWKKDGVVLANGPTGAGSSISGVTTTSLTITSIVGSDAGAYTFGATNPCSTATSTPIPVTVNVALPGDYNADGHVNGNDLAVLLGAWGTVDAQVDLTGDGNVDGADLGVLLGAWG